MKLTTLRLATLALFPAAMLALTSCSSPPPPEVNESATVIETATSTSIVDTRRLIATVAAIDPVTRQVILTLADGKSITNRCGPEVVNFSQLRVQDQVDVAVTEKFAVFLGADTAPRAVGVATASRAPVGALPGGDVGEAVSVTAQVTAIDFILSRLTVLLPDGSSKTIRVGSQLDISTLRIGDTVTVQRSENLAISVKQP